MRYYSKIELILSECETVCTANDSIETGKGIHRYQSRYIQPESSQVFDQTSINSNSIKNFSFSSQYRSQKFLSILKIALIILMYYAEIVPYYSIQIYSLITNSIEGIREFSVQITLLLADLIPLTNAFFILFIHEETWQELRLCGAIWENWISRRL
jgi:hypothetical protein